MRPSDVDCMTPAHPDFASAGITIDQRPAHRAAAARLAVFIPVAGLLLFPFYLLASAAFADQGLRDFAAGRPMATAQVVLGLTLWLLLLGLPIARLTNSLARRRTVRIANGQVQVADHVRGQTRTWTAPITDFEGIAHYLRASLSGVRHELILVHPDRERSLLLAVSDRLTQSHVDQACGSLGVREVPAKVYRRAPRSVADRHHTESPAAAAA